MESMALNRALSVDGKEGALGFAHHYTHCTTLKSIAKETQQKSIVYFTLNI